MSRATTSVPARGGARAHPSVSVVVAVHDGARYLRESLASALAQSLPPAQVIVVDDGSTDGSAEIAETFAAGRVQVVRQINAGQSAARNAGLRLVEHPLVAFLDQDDLWRPGHLRELAGALELDRDAGWAYSDFDEIDGDGHLVMRRFHHQHAQVHPKHSLADMLSADLMILPSASMVRTDVLRAVGGFDEELCGYEDDDLFIRMFRAGWHAAYVPRPSVKFRVHTTSSSASASFAASRVRFLDKLIAEIPENQRMNRFYVRDLAQPRLLRTTVDEYLTALRAGDDDRTQLLATTATAIASRYPMTLRRRAALAMLHRPAAVRRVLAARERLPRALRRRVFAGLVYRRDVTAT